MSSHKLIAIIFTIALSLACSSVASITPSPQPISPSPTDSPLSKAIEASQSMPLTIPEGFTVETEESVGISIARPTNWERNTGSKDLSVSSAPVKYVVYYHAEPGIIQTMSIQTLGIYYPYQSDADFINGVLGVYADKVAETNLRVIDFANSANVANHPGQALVLPDRRPTLWSTTIQHYPHRDHARQLCGHPPVGSKRKHARGNYGAFPQDASYCSTILLNSQQ